MVKRIREIMPEIADDVARGLQFRGGAAEARPDVEGTPFWVECKSGRSISTFQALAQATAETDGRYSVVIHHVPDHKQPRSFAAMPQSHFVAMMDQVVSRDDLPGVDVRYLSSGSFSPYHKYRDLHVEYRRRDRRPMLVARHEHANTSYGDPFVVCSTGLMLQFLGAWWRDNKEDIMADVITREDALVERIVSVLYYYTQDAPMDRSRLYRSLSGYKAAEINEAIAKLKADDIIAEWQDDPSGKGRPKTWYGSVDHGWGEGEEDGGEGDEDGGEE